MISPYARSPLLPLWEKVPEGRMRGMELSIRNDAWDGAAPLTLLFV
jgi:hypothetical protein